MKIKTIDLIGELERLAAACPWDHVDLWISREPKGKFAFTAYVPENEKFGFPSAFGSSDTPAGAVDEAIKRCANRDPEIARKQKIAELQTQIERLQSVMIGMPPYRPNRELTNGEPAITVPDPTINV